MLHNESQNIQSSQVWWHMSVILTPGRPRLNDLMLEQAWTTKGVQGQHGLHSKTLSHKTNPINKNT